MHMFLLSRRLVSIRKFENALNFKKAGILL